MSDSVYPDIKGNIGPELGEIMMQTIVEKNGRQHVQQVVVKKSLLKNSPQHETFKYHPSQEPELYSCAASGYEITCRGIKCKAHIITQKVKPTKSIPTNILIICKAHEKHFNDKPLKEWYAWVKKNYPDNFKSVHEIAKFVYEQLDEYLKVI